MIGQWRDTMKYNRTNLKIWGLRAKVWATVIIIVLLTLNALFLSWWYEANFVKYVYAEKVTVLTPKPTVVNEETINDYMRVIFGSDYRVAHAIQQVECNSANKNYPKCTYITSREYSCGIFQINLKAHWNKVSVGKTFEEKCAYLNNPFNNILVAKSIFSDSGFYPWAGFTSGRYLNEL